MEKLYTASDSETELENGGERKLPAALYTFDFETDPFKEWDAPETQRIPEVFACGVYRIDTGEYWDCWASLDWFKGNLLRRRQDARAFVVEWLLEKMNAAPEGSMWFAHNGGKFDFHYLKDSIRGKVNVIGARIAQCRVGHVILRDSFALLPVALSKFGGKVEIDYARMEVENREKHKAEILHYMKEDCLVLAKALRRFIAEFGLHMTMAGASMKQLQKRHDFERIASAASDRELRQFYYGGRVECFEKGVLPGPWKIFDVNGMYASVMRGSLHPVSCDFVTWSGDDAKDHLLECDFAEIEATSEGALPWVNDKGQLTFPHRHGHYFATGHEIRAGIVTRTLKNVRTLKVWRGERHTTFSDFIDHFQAKRDAAKADADKLGDLFYKTVQNGAYGKFAQDPDTYQDWLVSDEIQNTDDGWVLKHVFPDAALRIWARPTQTSANLLRFNVATAASITGAARALLWQGLCKADRAIYCDTDSMMCRDYLGDVNPKRLGAWKLEANADEVAIAGKKMYAMFSAGECVKKASKGVRVSAEQIKSVAQGAEVTHRNAGPTFSLTRPTRFIHRKVKATA